MDLALVIPSGKTLTIDLNGYELNRGLNEAIAGGAVIRNSGTLTITDSKGGGAITGGYTSGDGGGIWNEGTLTIEGGTVTGNQTQRGGGIWSMGGMVTLTGGTITGNTSQDSGGIYLLGSTLNVSGDTAITGNRATMEGGGILYGDGATLNVEGAPVVKDNSAPTGANLLLQSDGRLELTGRLAKEAMLDVMTKKTDAVMTHGLAQNGSLDNSTYDNGNKQPVLKNGSCSST